MSVLRATQFVTNHDVGPSTRSSTTTRPRKVVQLRDLLVVYPIVVSIAKSLNLKELISLTLTDKSCFAFLRGGDWGDDLRHWNNLKSNCNEICEFNSAHEYLPPVKDVKACHKCRYGVCNHCVGPVGHLGSPRRQICPSCVEKRLASHIRYMNKPELPNCSCAGAEPWLCQMCWKGNYFSTFQESAGTCCDCDCKFVVGSKTYFVCKWCRGKML
ncbi:hypothetical protein P167DRAFT_201681 [Morchella conica CCBAS932]|uniref:Uncharacterized protein n=1 Tax=Morchella conica CCBAS932 TaxID=1392247 RepID=A0A3N4L2A7_9PEZI|nr:hypothetical protein P167DRAFT_201681 [Morchella conica CCBAS932]